MARILVIEDNLANRELMVYLLTAFNHISMEAADGQVGWETANRERPDLILCDLQLPMMDGYTLAQHFKSSLELKRIPLIAVTAFAMMGDREKVIAAGFDGYISKPITPELFVAQIEEYLRKGQNGNNFDRR